MKNSLITLFIFLSVSLFSQERREIIDGEELIIHTVKKGETLYGISKKYSVTKKQLRSSNSSFFLFIKTDQEIKIPIADSERTIHVVKKGETLYGIAKQYKLSTEQLVLMNPKKTLSLQVGDVLQLKKDKKKIVFEKVNTQLNTEFKAENTAKVEKSLESKSKLDFVKGNRGDIHIVKAGETIYAIARKYSITIDQLLGLNPQIENNTIAIGDKVNVPAQLEILKRDSEPVSEIKQVEYKVEKGETLYGISKKFNTTVEEITKINPSVTSLKIGDILKINVPNKGGKQIKIDLGGSNSIDTLNKLNEITPLKDKLNEMKKETYTISMFLPLMLDKNDQTLLGINKPKKLNLLTEMSTHFYQGVKLALDSVKTSGVSVNLNVYDTEKDTNKISKLLRTKKVKSSDLIIGPFYEKPYKQVANFSKTNQIQAISPVSQSNRVLFDNKYVTELQTSLPTQLTFLSQYLAANRNTENVICVSGKTKKEKYLSDLFSEKYNSFIAKKVNNYRSKASEYKMTSFSSIHGFDQKMVKGKKNIIILPFTQEGMASSFFTQLNVMMTRSKMIEYDIEIYALENFIKYEEINTDLKMRYNLHVTSSSFIDYKDEKVKDFVRDYRAKFGTEPSQYAFIGYDVAFYHTLAMKNYGRNFSDFYGQIQVPLLQSAYQLKRIDNMSGYENQAVFLLQYKNYELLKIVNSINY